MASNTNTVAAYFAPLGIELATTPEDFVINNNGKVTAYDIKHPGLNLRLYAAAKESQQGRRAFDSVKADKPYTSLDDQLMRLGVDPIPEDVLSKYRAMKPLTKEASITNVDFGEGFEGQTEMGSDIYIRVTTDDYVNVIVPLEEKYPEGITTVVDDDIRFIFGSYPGAASGFCPPISAEVFKVADPEPEPEKPKHTPPPPPPQHEDPRESYNPRDQRDYFNADERNYYGEFGDDLNAEVLTPEEESYREVFNSWAMTQEHGERFQIDSTGAFANPTVYNSFKTMRFDHIVKQANPYFYKQVAARCVQKLHEEVEKSDGRMTALKTVAICRMYSKLGRRPNWPIFLKFLQCAVPTCLQYVNQGFQQRGCFMDDGPEDMGDYYKRY